MKGQLEATSRSFGCLSAPLPISLFLCSVMSYACACQSAAAVTGLSLSVMHAYVLCLLTDGSAGCCRSLVAGVRTCVLCMWYAVCCRGCCGGNSSNCSMVPATPLGAPPTKCLANGKHQAMLGCRGLPHAQQPAGVLSSSVLVRTCQPAVR